jgi:hypothetical protein
MKWCVEISCSSSLPFHCSSVCPGLLSALFHLVSSLCTVTWILWCCIWIGLPGHCLVITPWVKQSCNYLYSTCFLLSTIGNLKIIWSMWEDLYACKYYALLHKRFEHKIFSIHKCSKKQFSTGTNGQL